jgi:hypothetical protein
MQQRLAADHLVDLLEKEVRQRSSESVDRIGFA